MIKKRDLDADVNADDLATLAARLDRVFAADPRLRPRPEMHDYQLTYPPAVQVEKPAHRHTPSDAEYVADAVGELTNAAFYFHFGFCQYRCRYCHHYEIRTNHDADLMARYVDALCTEMRRVRDLAPHLKRLIYFMGGGTPTALPPALLHRFLDRLLDTFGPPATALSTVEVKPITASNQKLSMLVEAGFSRINLGVQTLDPALYRYHHHDEDLGVALDAIERARTCGFEYINIDILTGLERQTPESWRVTLAALERLAATGAVDSVFIYPYHDDPRSRTFAKTDALPSFAETAHSDAQARALFTRLGWKELGTRFYRAPRHVRRELFELAKVRANPSYGELLYHGFGNSSFSVGDRATYLNQRNALDYCTQIESGRLGISHWTTLDAHQRATRDLTFDILYSPIVRVRSISRKYGADTMQAHIAQLECWTGLGLGRWNRVLGIWRLTPLGKLVHLQMLPALYLPRDHTRFIEVMEERLASGRSYRGY